MFIRNHLKYSLIKDLCKYKKGQYEALWVDILSNTKRVNKFTFGVVYRRPGLGEIISFADHFENVLGILDNNKSIHFFGKSSYFKLY